MERCVHKHLFNYINENQLLTPFQSGFVPGDSTTRKLLHTYHTFCEAVDSGKEVRAVFCDISKAFDRVWHNGLLYKLTRLGCSDQVIKCFTSYLSDRQQCVVLGGATSDWPPVYAGVPQGSILGPLLFLVFINDIVKGINSSIRLFADDTSLYIIVENSQTHTRLTMYYIRALIYDFLYWCLYGLVLEALRSALETVKKVHSCTHKKRVLKKKNKARQK